MQTGKPFAEIVLLHTLIYSVEQVFLIHRETGLLLQHVATATAGIKDVDMVSGMLTAIQDFVHDSFGASEDQMLQSLHVGEFTVWIEQGPYVALAAVIQGNPPEELWGKLEDAVEKIEFEQSRVLQEFKGDVAPFAASRYHLDSCLVQAKLGMKETGTAHQSTASAALQSGKKRGKLDLIWLIIGAGLVCLVILILGIIFSLTGRW